MVAQAFPLAFQFRQLRCDYRPSHSFEGSTLSTPDLSRDRSASAQTGFEISANLREVNSEGPVMFADLSFGSLRPSPVTPGLLSQPGRLAE